MITAVVVDDDHDTVDVLCEYLELAKISILGTGANGKDAVKLFENLNPDVLFLDIMMPYYDGFYALEKLTKLNSNRNVIIVTADLRTDTEERLKKFNVPTIIYKPFDFDEIVKAIERITKKPVVENPMAGM